MDIINRSLTGKSKTKTCIGYYGFKRPMACGFKQPMDMALVVTRDTIGIKTRENVSKIDPKVRDIQTRICPYADLRWIIGILKLINLSEHLRWWHAFY